MPAGTDNTTVSGLSPDTSHTFKAYSDGACATELAAAASFTTLLAKVANVSVAPRDGSLAVSWDARTGATGYDVQWKSDAEDWDSTNRQSSVTGTSAAITTLTNDTEYTIRVRSKKSGDPGNTGEWSDEAKGTPADETLTVSNIASTGATLTIGNYGGSWHYKHTTPSSGTCSSAVATASTTVSGLDADTAHVFKAYSDGGCATELATGGAVHDAAGEGGERVGFGAGRVAGGVVGRAVERDRLRRRVEVGGRGVGFDEPAGVGDGRVAHDSDPDERHGVHDPGAVEEDRQHRRVVGRGEGDAGGRDADGLRDPPRPGRR